MSTKPYDEWPWWCQLLWPWSGVPWYEEIEDFDAFLAAIRQQFARQADELAADLAGDDRPCEGYLAKAGRLTDARHQAEEIISHEYGLPVPDGEDDGDQGPAPGTAPDRPPRRASRRGRDQGLERADQHDRGEQRERPLAAPGRGRGASVSGTRDAFMPPSGLAGGGRSHGLAAGKQCPAVVK